MNEPIEWQHYDQSSLPALLRHDTWDPMKAISLFCEIDPKYSELFKPEIYYNTSLVEPRMHDEAQPFWMIKLLSADRKAIIPRCWYSGGDDFAEASADREQTWKQWADRSDPYVSLSEVLAPHFAAERRFVEVRELFDSSPDHIDDPIRTPKYFIEWAKSKGIEIKWLDWSEDRGLISTSEDTSTDDIDSRREANLLRIVAALVTEFGLRTGESEAELIRQLVDAYSQNSGVSKSNLERVFAEAKRLLNQ